MSPLLLIVMVPIIMGVAAFLALLLGAAAAGAWEAAEGRAQAAPPVPMSATRPAHLRVAPPTRTQSRAA